MANFTLHYQNDTDRANGCAGMMISLLAIGDEDKLAEIRLDAPAGSNMIMSHDFGYRGNPRMAAKVVWASTMNQLRTIISMMFGNILCRHSLADGLTLSDGLLSRLKDLVRNQAAEECGLDTDEADSLFANCHAHARRLFAHTQVLAAASALSQRLEQRRTLSCAEALELLSSLGLR